jgi:hypothetical protein
MSCAYMPDPNAWNGKLDGLKVKPAAWGKLCERADMGLSGNEEYKDCAFPEGIPFIKVYVSGVSRSDNFLYLASGIRPTVTSANPEPEVIQMQEAVSSVV